MISLLPAANGQLSLKYQDKWLYSSYKPVEKAEEMLPKIVERALYLCPSPLLGYGLNLLLEQLPQSSFCICFEKNEHLKQVTLNYFEDISSSKILFIEATDDALSQALKTIAYQFDHVTLVTLNAGYFLYKNFYDEFFRQAASYIKSNRLNSYMLDKKSSGWFNNIAFNIDHLAKTYEPFFGADPVVVVAAGPSLDEHIGYLHQHRACYRLVVVDTALPVLIHHGLYPDAIFAIEGGYYNLRDFYGCINLDVPLIYDLSAHKATSRMAKGKKAVFFSEFTSSPEFDRLKKRGIMALPPLGSVAITAIGYLIAKKVESIYLCGFDFSYFINKSHANGSYSHVDSLLTSTRFNPWPITINSLKRPIKPLRYGQQGVIYSDEVLENYAQIINSAQHPELRQLKGKTGYPLNLEIGHLSCLKPLILPLKWQEVFY